MVGVELKSDSITRLPLKYRGSVIMQPCMATISTVNTQEEGDSETMHRLVPARYYIDQ